MKKLKIIIDIIKDMRKKKKLMYVWYGSDAQPSISPRFNYPIHVGKGKKLTIYIEDI